MTTETPVPPSSQKQFDALMLGMATLAPLGKPSEEEEPNPEPESDTDEVDTIELDVPLVCVTGLHDELRRITEETRDVVGFVAGEVKKPKARWSGYSKDERDLDEDNPTGVVAPNRLRPVTFLERLGAWLVEKRTERNRVRATEANWLRRSYGVTPAEASRDPKLKEAFKVRVDVPRSRAEARHLNKNDGRAKHLTARARRVRNNATPIWPVQELFKGDALLEMLPEEQRAEVEELDMSPIFETPDGLDILKNSLFYEPYLDEEVLSVLTPEEIIELEKDLDRVIPLVGRLAPTEVLNNMSDSDRKKFYLTMLLRVRGLIDEIMSTVPPKPKNKEKPKTPRYGKKHEGYL